MTPGMTPDTLLGAVILAVIGYIGQRWVANRAAESSERNTSAELEIKWVQELRSEIGELRTQVDDLRQKVETQGFVVDSLGDFLDALSAFALYGRVGEYPTPPADEAAKHYNRERWLAIKAEHDANCK